MLSKTRLVLISTIVILLILLGILVVLLFEQGSNYQAISLGSPKIHDPPYAGHHAFIVNSGVLLQQGYAYSYVVIDSTLIKTGDAFLALPALNVGLRSNGIDWNNFTLRITFHGSLYPSSVFWINFSIDYPQSSNLIANYTHMGVGGARSSSNLGGFGSAAKLFTQTAPVLREETQFEFYYYIGNSSTLVPVLTFKPPT